MIIGPTPSPTADLVVSTVEWPSWDAWATLGAAVVAACLAAWSVTITKRTSAREHALTRLGDALEKIDSGVDHKVAYGHRLLKSLKKSKWISDEDRLLAVHTLRAYNRSKSNPG